jgi:hypothetical protein
MIAVKLILNNLIVWTDIHWSSHLKFFPHSTSNFNEPKSLISLLNFLNLRYSSVYCSNSLLSTEGVSLDLANKYTVITMNT